MIDLEKNTAIELTGVKNAADQVQYAVPIEDGVSLTGVLSLTLVSSLLVINSVTI